MYAEELLVPHASCVRHILEMRVLLLSRGSMRCCTGAFSSPLLLYTAVAPNVQTEFLPVYQQQLKDMIIGQVDKEGPARDRPLEGLKVVVNAGNGMGGFLADTLTEVGVRLVIGYFLLKEQGNVLSKCPAQLGTLIQPIAQQWSVRWVHSSLVPPLSTQGVCCVC